MSGHDKRRSKIPLPPEVESPYEISAGGHSGPEIYTHGARLEIGPALDEAAVGRQDIHLPVAGRTRVDVDKAGGWIGIDPYPLRITVEADLSHCRIRD